MSTLDPALTGRQAPACPKELSGLRREEGLTERLVGAGAGQADAGPAVWERRCGAAGQTAGPGSGGFVVACWPFWTRRMGSEFLGVALWKTERAGARPLALRCRRGPCTLPSGLRQAPCLPRGSTTVPPGQGPSQSGRLGHAGTRAHSCRWECGSLGFSETHGILGQKLSPRSVSPSGGNVPPCASLHSFLPAGGGDQRGSVCQVISAFRRITLLKPLLPGFPPDASLSGWWTPRSPAGQPTSSCPHCHLLSCGS